MPLNLQQTSAPASEPITLVEAKEQLRVSSSAEDTYITTLIKAARAYAESQLRRQLITATWAWQFDGFPFSDAIELPKPPLQSVTSIQYIDPDGATQTFSSGSYSVETNTDPGQVILGFGEAWPSVRDVPDSVTITFVAGYGLNGSDIPEDIRHIVRLILSHWFEERMPVREGRPSKVPDAVDALVSQYRVVQLVS